MQKLPHHERCGGPRGRDPYGPRRGQHAPAPRRSGRAISPSARPSSLGSGGIRCPRLKKSQAARPHIPGPRCADTRRAAFDLERHSNPSSVCGRVRPHYGPAPTGRPAGQRADPEQNLESGLGFVMTLRHPARVRGRRGFSASPVPLNPARRPIRRWRTWG
jgi:hypothetical protein